MAGYRKRQNEFMESILRNWYGKQEGEAEMVRYTPQTASIAESLDKVVNGILPPWEMKVQQVKEQWNEIAGPENARRCSPAFLNNGIFYIEVTHPAYRVALDVPAIRNRFKDRIVAIIGSNLCQDIKFIAGGRSLPRKK